MLRDIIENTQLAVMNSLASLVDLVAPEPEVRSVIRDGNAKVNAAKQDYNNVRALLGQESKLLKATHVSERQALAEKHNGELVDMRCRHAETTERAQTMVRETRTMVISDIANVRAGRRNGNRQLAFA